MQFPDSVNVQHNFGMVQIPRLRGAHNICKLTLGLGSKSSGTVRVLVQIYYWVQRVRRLKVFLATLVIEINNCDVTGVCREFKSKAV